jgi:hypothetical protein
MKDRGMLLDEGSMLALDDNSGAVYAGQVAIETDRPEAALATIETWRVAAAAKEGLNKRADGLSFLSS